MNKSDYGRSLVLFVAIFCLLTAGAYGQRVYRSSSVIRLWKKEFVFKGIVENVDANAKSVTVRNENIPGCMNSLSNTYTRMTYQVDHPEVLKTVNPGDRVAAKVYECDSKVLYELMVAPPEDTPVFFPRK